MVSLHTGSYSRKLPDLTMWSEFDALARRLKLSTSSAIALAAREWYAAHRNDPTPELVVPPRRRGKTLPPEKDPFAGR